MGPNANANRKSKSTSTSLVRSVHFTVLISILAVQLLAAQTQQGQGAQDKPQVDPKLRITQEGLLRFLERYQGDHVSEAMAIRMIDLQGLSFTPTEDDLKALKQASASPEFINAINRARKPPVPEVKTGNLLVDCRPVDCTVWLNGVSVGQTNSGSLPLSTVPQGLVRISATRQNYNPDRKAEETLIRPNETTRVEFTLKPSREALLESGRTLFQEMQGGLGRVSESSVSSLRASGKILVDSVGEPEVTWSIVFWTSKGGEASVEISRNREKHQITRNQDGYVWKKTPKSAEARSLDLAVRLALDHQLDCVLGRLRNPNVVMIAPDLVLHDQNAPTFRAEASWGTYAITLDSAHRPTEIVMESSGLNSGLKIRYSEFIEEGGMSYPLNTQIVLPDRLGSVELRLEKIRIGAPRDADGAL